MEYENPKLCDICKKKPAVHDAKNRVSGYTCELCDECVNIKKEIKMWEKVSIVIVDLVNPKKYS